MHRILLAFALIAFTPFAQAQQPDGAPAPRPRNPNVIISTYEVGDLVVTIPDYIAPQDSAGAASVPMGGGGMSGGGGYRGEGLFGGRGVDPAGNPMGGAEPGAFGSGPVTMGSLMNVIVHVVDPNSWSVAGGDGAVEFIGSALVVSNTREVHEQIEKLLHQLRSGSANRRSVAVDARWLLLNSDDLERLNKRDAKGNPKVDRNVLDELTRRPTSLRGLTNCFSGQGVYLISGTRRNVVRSYIPVVGSTGGSGQGIGAPEGLKPYQWADAPRTVQSVFHFVANEGGRGGDNPFAGGFDGGRGVGYQPVIETPNFGVLLRIRPTLIVGEEAAVVDLTSTITFPGVAANDGHADFSAPAPGAAPMVDRLAIDTQELATTMRVPLAQPVLVGGMSYIAPGPAADPTTVGAPPAQETPQLYMVLEVR